MLLLCKDKVKLPFLIKHHPMKTHGEVQVLFHAFVKNTCQHLKLCGTKWRRVSASSPSPLYPEKIAPSEHWIGGALGPRSVSGGEENKKLPRPEPFTFISELCTVLQSDSELYTSTLFINGLCKALFTRKYSKETERLRESPNSSLGGLVTRVTFQFLLSSSV
jgi:hypothetical protein